MVMRSLVFLLLRLDLGFGGGVHIPLKEIARGVRMPVMSIGTGGLERDNATQIVKNWLKLGGRGIDTALAYRDQGAVTQAIVDSGLSRQDVFITSKIPGCIGARESVELDLKQLQTDYIDLLLIHFPLGDCVEAWKVLEEFHAKGKLKAIGLSNFNQSQLDPILNVAKVVPAVNQVLHNVLEHDDATIGFCAAHGITLEAFSPLGRGGHQGDVGGNEIIKAVGVAHGVSAYQVALRWIVQHGHALTFQSTSMEHQQEDADIFSFSLSPVEMVVLDNLQQFGGPNQLLV